MTSQPKSKSKEKIYNQYRGTKKAFHRTLELDDDAKGKLSNQTWAIRKPLS